jgi:hypothetical protein
LIMEDGKPNRRSYETAVIATLRDRLRAGDAWVEGSRDYRRFDAYLMSKPEAAKVLGPTGLPTDGKEWLKDRSALLNDRLSDVQTKLEAGKLEGVRLESGRLKITPHDPVTPAAGEQLDRAIDAVMPRIRITDLLWDVNQQTGFLDSFTDLRSGRNHTNPPAVLAAILAGASKGEARHSLAKAVFAHSQGRIHDRSVDAQQKRAMALNLVIAAIVYWNTMYMDKAAQHLLKAGQLADPSLLRHVSPLGWMHINLTGDFVWNSGAAERMNARPLHLSATRKWAS